MSDIFDRLAKKQDDDEPDDGGDIFDQLAKKSEHSFGDVANKAIEGVKQIGGAIGNAAQTFMQHPVETVDAGVTGVMSGLNSIPEVLINSGMALTGQKGAVNLQYTPEEMQAMGVDPKKYHGAIELGNMAGQGAAFVPGGLLAGPAKAGGMIAGVAKSALTGEALGASMDMSQRQQAGLPLDIGESLYAGAPLALTAGAIDATLHGAGKALDKKPSPKQAKFDTGAFADDLLMRAKAQAAVEDQFAPKPTLDELVPGKSDSTPTAAAGRAIPSETPQLRGQVSFEQDMTDALRVMQLEQRAAEAEAASATAQPVPKNLFASENKAANPPRKLTPDQERAQSATDRFFKGKDQKLYDDPNAPKAGTVPEDILGTAEPVQPVPAEPFGAAEPPASPKDLGMFAPDAQLAPGLQAILEHHREESRLAKQQSDLADILDRMLRKPGEVTKGEANDLPPGSRLPTVVNQEPGGFKALDEQGNAPPARPSGYGKPLTKAEEKLMQPKPAAKPVDEPMHPKADPESPSFDPESKEARKQMRADMKDEQRAQRNQPAASIEPVKKTHPWDEQFPKPGETADAVDDVVKGSWKPPRPDLDLVGSDNRMRTGAADQFVQAGLKRIQGTELHKAWSEAVDAWKTETGKRNLEKGAVPLNDRVSGYFKNQFDSALNKVLLEGGQPAARAFFKRINEEAGKFIKGQEGTGSASGFFEPGSVLDNAVKEAIKLGKHEQVKNFMHGELDGRVFTRLGGLETTTDAVRRYDKDFSANRDAVRSKLKQVMAGEGGRDFVTEESIKLRHEAMRVVDPTEILTDAKFDKLTDKQRRTLFEAKKITDDYVDNHLKPRIDALDSEGIKAGAAGKYRLRRMLEGDLEDLRPSAGSEGFAWLNEARSGLHRSIFRGNWHTALLHGVEGTLAGVTHDPVAWGKAQAELGKAYASAASGKANAIYDFVTSHHGAAEMEMLNNMEGGTHSPHFMRNPIGNTIRGAAEGLGKGNDWVVKQLDKNFVGKTFIDVARAQIPEKYKMQSLNLLTLIRHAEALEYPGGAEGLAKDYMSQANGGSLPTNRQVLLDKARIAMFQDMNRIVLDAPHGWAEKTAFQRGGWLELPSQRKVVQQIGSLVYPFTRSVLQQSRMVASYADDVVAAAAKGDAVKAGYAMASLTGFLGMTAVASGKAALPPQIEAMATSDDPDIRKAHKDIKNLVDFIHDISHNPVTVDHLKWKPTILDIAEHAGESSFAEGIKDAWDRTGDPDTNDKQRFRSMLMLAALARLDNIGGLIGTQQAFNLFNAFKNAEAGKRKEAVYKEGRQVKAKNFKTDLSNEMTRYFMLGTPNNVAEWKDKIDSKYTAKHAREPQNPLKPSGFYHNMYRRPE